MEYIISQTILVLCAVGCLSRPYQRPADYYAPAPVGHDGRVIDTPEVAQAKAAHLAAFNKAATRPLNSYYNAPSPYVPVAATGVAYQLQGAYSNPGFFSARIQHGPYGYQGPPAPLADDGRVVDTPEVAQAKAAHFAAFSQATSRSYNAPAPHNVNDDYNEYGAYNNNSDDDDGSGSDEGHYEGGASSQYQGPPAPLAQDGRVIDTPEVAQAKAAHVAAHHRAQKGYVPQAFHNGYYGDY